MDYAKYVKFREMFKQESVGIYEHFKGGMYVVLDIAFDTEKQDVLVIYTPHKGEKSLFARPYHIFFNKNNEGKPRFKKIDN